MKTFFNTYKLLLPFSSIISLTSCKKMVEVAPPKNQLTTSIVFSDSVDATAAVVGIYSRIMNLSTNVNIGNGAVTSFTGLSSDELYTTSTDPALLQFYTNSIQNDNNTNWGLLWKSAYEVIYHVNACIAGLSETTTLNVSIKNQLLGETKFLRALFYFNLINLYGDVPLVTSINYHENAVMPRTPLALVYDQIVKDLVDAQQFISVNYVTAGKLRPNTYTVTALLARVYLYQKQWARSEMEATKIINSAAYSLESNLNNTFLAGSLESIWEMPRLQSPAGTPEGFQFLPASSSVIPKYVVTDNLLNSFETNDQRRINWLKANTIGTAIYYYPYKYKIRVNPTPLENYVMFRLAEQYLIRAEARANQNNVADAISDLNMIRNRAGLPNTAASDSATLIPAILKERRIELFCEWGHRWYDLKRTNTITAVLGPVKPAWQPTDVLYPIHISELYANPFLTQNPGY